MITAALRRASVWLRPRTGWRHACPAGPPVPGQDACADCPSVLLPALRPGRTATIACLEDPAGEATAKLAALGILPGVRLRVLQQSPMHVIRIGYTDLALDDSLARRVRVQPLILDL